MNIKTLGIISTVAIIAGVVLGYVIRDDAALGTLGKTTIQPTQQQTALGYMDNTPKHVTAQSGPAAQPPEAAVQESEKGTKAEITPDTAGGNPLVKEITTYEVHMMKETRDNQWAQTVEATVEDLIHAPALSSLSPVSSECRSTLCRWELASNDELEAVNAERVLVEALAQKDGGSTLVRRIQDPAGSGLRLVVLYARPGYALPAMEQ